MKTLIAPIGSCRSFGLGLGGKTSCLSLEHVLLGWNRGESFSEIDSDAILD